jgi:alkanesulfonate monooxygenase SsuD/methylene tetrahydromethanopterin reductase-like flavin-dependent oxidoreductase (luciferase family)
MDIGTFLLMQSPAGRPSQEVTRAASSRRRPPKSLYRGVWLGEHHFSTYGYLSRPCQLATYIAAKTSKLERARR